MTDNLVCRLLVSLVTLKNVDKTFYRTAWNLSIEQGRKSATLTGSGERVACYEAHAGAAVRAASPECEIEGLKLRDETTLKLIYGADTNN